MPEFEAITTQEKFDEMIKERLAREVSKYKDYEEIKIAKETYEAQVRELTSKDAQYDQKINELNEKIKGYESASVKTRIALEKGLPFDLVDRLKGDDEEAIRKDAEALAKFIGGNVSTPPAANIDDENIKEEDAAYRKILENLK